MKIKWDKIFYFTKTERNGVFVLLCLCFLGFLTPKLWSILKEPVQTNFEDFDKEIEAFEKKSLSIEKEPPSVSASEIKRFAFNPNTAAKEEFLQLGLSPKVTQTIINYRNSGAKFYKKEDFKKVYGIKDADYEQLAPYILIPKNKLRPIKKKSPTVVEKNKKKTLTPFLFNPNTASKQDLLNLGLSSKVAQTILNYRAKGGEFRYKTDLKRIYGLADTDYQTLTAYIDIPKPKQKKSITAKTNIPKDIPQTFSEPVAIKIDANTATEEEWQKLKGIGPVYAKKIVHFRDNLGGFASIEQIGKTYSVPDSVFQKVKTQLILSPIPNKIPINAVTPEMLKNHPYIKSKQAYIIINYRVNHGNFKSIEDIKKIKALSPSLIEQIEPYLSFE